MNIVLDTNVFISGIFFTGPPNRILKAWRQGEIRLTLSASILEEYRRVGIQLANQFRGIDITPILHVLMTHARFVSSTPLDQQVCQDPDDDKFLACAIAGKCHLLVSGD